MTHVTMSRLSSLVVIIFDSAFWDGIIVSPVALQVWDFSILDNGAIYRYASIDFQWV